MEINGQLHVPTTSTTGKTLTLTYLGEYYFRSEWCIKTSTCRS